MHLQSNKHKLSYSCDIKLFFTGQGLLVPHLKVEGTIGLRLEYPSVRPSTEILFVCEQYSGKTPRRISTKLGGGIRYGLIVKGTGIIKVHQLMLADVTPD